MADHQFVDGELASWYDALSPRRSPSDFDFYLELVLAAEAVLDVGCGTGTLLHRARDAGHRGRLCGLDPAPGMLAQARGRTDVEWILGDLASAGWEREFDLVVMSGHAFRVFVEDAEIRASLAAMRSALVDGGRVAFETRNPLARAWERWVPDHAVEATDADGTVVRSWNEVETPVVGDVVRFRTTFTCSRWDGPRHSRSTLRFLAADALSSFVAEAGLTIEERFGNWDRSPLTDTSPEIIVVATR